tara:strand:- start:12863 stop:15910 length:3048 start_codon:yes stop_codon:yes gene_type:complete
MAFLLCGFTFAQKTITGAVVDGNNIPLPGVNVIVKGTTTGTATDFDGNYSLNVENDSAIIEISYVGYKTVEVTVGNQTIINITLQEDSEALDEVIITAQGIRKSKKALGYAITKLDSEEIEQRPEASLAKTLQGKIAGVSIGTTSGQSGSASSISIRGSVSINQSNSPLIVVNNVPFNGSLSDIDPNNIVSLNVLKGLNAAVLYGSEGRNGVILIQTKSGNTALGESRTTASFSTTTYVNVASQLPDFQNTYGQGQAGSFIPTFLSVWGPEFSSVDEVSHPYASLGSVFPEFDGATVPYTAKPDNVKNFFNLGIGKIYSMNVSTSTDKLGFNVSVGYTDEEGVVDNNDLKRFNISVGGNAQVTDKLSISSTLNYSTRKINFVLSEESTNRIYYLPRNIDLTELPYQNPLTGESVYYRNDNNPLWIINNAGINNDIVRVFGTFNANYKFNDKLNLTYRVGYGSEQFDRFSYSNKGGFNGAFLNGYLNIDALKEVEVDQTLMVSFNKDLTGDLNFEAQIGANSKLTTNKSFTSDFDQQIAYGFLRPDNYAALSDSNYFKARTNIAGVFGQFQFGYKNYLYATVSGRNDWGSTVEADNQSIFYPGTSVSFIPTSAFEFGGDVINYLKFRAAYATSSGFPGRFRTRNELIIDALRFAADDGSFPVTNRFSNVFGNPDLTPELHREFEIGIETKLFNNRVSLEASLYKRISEDQIVQSELSPSTGFSTKFVNIGRIDNKGIEVDLGIKIIKNDNFKWNLRNIFTADESLVVETLAGSRIPLIADRFAVEGYPYGAIVGDYALRDEEGNLLISGNGGSTRVGEVIASSDVGLRTEVIGDPNPDWKITTINSLSYKNFNFSAQIEYTHGGDISSRAVEDLLERGVTRDTENRNGSFVIPGFLADDDTGEILLDPNGNKIPNTIQMNGLRTVFSNYYNSNDLSMWDASVFRIREIALGYTLSRKKGGKLPFEKIDITLTGRNLWYIAPNFPKYVNFDPESDRGLGRNTIPTNKRFALGVSLTF